MRTFTILFSMLSLYVTFIGYTPCSSPSAFVHAQKESKKRTADEQTESAKPKETVTPKISQRAVDVLRATADDSRNWKNAAAAAMTQAQVADLTWEVDPETATAYLTQAWETSAKVSDDTQTGSPRISSARTSTKREILLVARKRSPDLAKRWLDLMTKEAESDSRQKDRGVFDDRTRRSTVLLEMALSIAQQDPNGASELAKESLDDGISFGLQDVLIAIQQQSFDL